MIQIIGPQLSQWDTGRSLEVGGSTATHAHFANRGDSHAVIMELVDGKTKIPDYLLQPGKDLCVYLVLDGVTQESKTFSVRKREKPENYVYEEDRRNYIYALITDALAATAAANDAAGAANNAAQNATKAATSANEAAGNANVAGNSANEAAKNANEAATKAAHTAKSFMVIGGADGTVIHMDNAADQVLVGLRIFGKTTQNGTPTPDAPVDLVSVGDVGSMTVTAAGKNLISNNWRQGMLKTEDGTTLISNDYWITNADYIPVDSSKAYVLSADTPNSCCVFWYDEDKNFISFEQPLRNLTSPSNLTSKALMLPDYAKYVRVAYNYAGATEVITPAMMGVNHYVQLECGSTATKYQMYTATTATMTTVTEDGNRNGLPGIPVTSGGNYTDANGQQWICDEIDFSRGVYVQRCKEIVIDGTGGITVGQHTNSQRYCTQAVPDILELTPPDIPKMVMSDKYEAFVWTDQNNRVYCIGTSIIITDSRFTDKATATAILQVERPKVVYVLATPIETPLSEEELAAYAALHTYRNNTTVSNDASAHMELEYVMDAKKYIDSKIAGAILAATVE